MESTDLGHQFLCIVFQVEKSESRVSWCFFESWNSNWSILLERCLMGMPESGSTSVFERTSPPKKLLQLGLESDIVQDHLGLKSPCARQKVAKPILVQPSSIIVATKSASSIQKLRMWLLVDRLKGFASNAAGMSDLGSYLHWLSKSASFWTQEVSLTVRNLWVFISLFSSSSSPLCLFRCTPGVPQCRARLK